MTLNIQAGTQLLTTLASFMGAADCNLGQGNTASTGPGLMFGQTIRPEEGTLHERVAGD